jgi:hypothetical protein
MAQQLPSNSFYFTTFWWKLEALVLGQYIAAVPLTLTLSRRGEERTKR